ncbi:MAG: hypothetical protein WB421_16100 [Terriglobales bacterium]|jgi:hypothetical protein
MKIVFGLFVIVAAVYLGAELVPAYYGNYEFADFVKTTATMETYTTKPESDIRDAVFKKAQQMEIPISKDAIKVQRQGAQNVGSLSIICPYTVHVDLVLYPVDLHFQASSENKSPF